MIFQTHLQILLRGRKAMGGMGGASTRKHSPVHFTAWVSTANPFWFICICTCICILHVLEFPFSCVLGFVFLLLRGGAHTLLKKHTAPITSIYKTSHLYHRQSVQSLFCTLICTLKAEHLAIKVSKAGILL